MTARAAAWLAWSLAGLSVVLFAAQALLYVLALSAPIPERRNSDMGIVNLLWNVLILIFLVVGALIASRQPGTRLAGSSWPMASCGPSTTRSPPTSSTRWRSLARFYRKKYDARQTLKAFSARLRNETDLHELNGELTRVVREKVEPAYASLWLRPDTRLKDEPTN